MYELGLFITLKVDSIMNLRDSNQVLCNMWLYNLYEKSHVMRKSVFAKFDQQRHRSACASAQSD